MNVFFCSFNTFIVAYQQSDIFGKLIFLGLIALSMIGWIVLVNKIHIARKIEKMGSRFQKALFQSDKPLLSISLESLPFAKVKEIQNPFSLIFSSFKNKTLEILDKNLYFSKQLNDQGNGVFLCSADLELLETQLMTTISSEVKNLEKNLFVLTTIVTLAPFLGLLGTVWGILITFSELNKGGSISSNTMILGGLSTALVTTVLGLIIAIPALVSYNYLKAKVRLLANEMQDFLYRLLSKIELQYRSVSK